MSETVTPVTALSLPVPRTGINPWFIAITVTLATFMELLDAAIANVALPHIAGGLAVSADESTWVGSAFSFLRWRCGITQALHWARIIDMNRWRERCKVLESRRCLCQ